MPIRSCSVGRKKGFKAYSKGKCYLSKKKAIKQLVAIKISQGKIKVKRKR